MGRGFDSRRERQVFMQKVLATSVKLGDQAILIQGKSGTGKSMLAMRLITQHGALLISDDVTGIQSKDGVLYAETIPEIVGRLEVRGVGIIQLPCVSHVPVACVIELDQSKSERMPKDKSITINDIQIPLFTFDSNFAYNDLQVLGAVTYLKQKDGSC